MQVSRPERKVWVNLPTLVSANLQTNCIQKFPLIYFRYNKILNLYQLQHVLSQNKMKVLIEKSFMRGYYSPLMMLQTSMGILRKGSICQRILQCLLIPDARGWNSTSFFFFFFLSPQESPRTHGKGFNKSNYQEIILFWNKHSYRCSLSQSFTYRYSHEHVINESPVGEKKGLTIAPGWNLISVGSSHGVEE